MNSAWTSIIAAAVLAAPMRPAAADDATARAGVIYNPAGQHLWKKEADRGYFKIFSVEVEAAITLHKDPSSESSVIKPLHRGDIVVSDGTSHWGGAISWRRIMSGLDDGWIPERNLVRARPRLLGSSLIPAAGTCWGHAPAWKASWTDKLVQISLFPGRTELGIGAVLATQEPRTAMLAASAGGLSVEFVYTSEACAPVQGQSLVGTTGVLIVTEQSGKRLLSGCCEASPAAFAD